MPSDLDSDPETLKNEYDYGKIRNQVVIMTGFPVNRARIMDIIMQLILEYTYVHKLNLIARWKNSST